MCPTQSCCRRLTRRCLHELESCIGRMRVIASQSDLWIAIVCWAPLTEAIYRNLTRVWRVLSMMEQFIHLMNSQDVFLKSCAYMYSCLPAFTIWRTLIAVTKSIYTIRNCNTCLGIIFWEERDSSGRPSNENIRKWLYYKTVDFLFNSINNTYLFARFTFEIFIFQHVLIIG